jgi:creatinine amidohydrolase/Fe(II)-dependent formamide hydrolase-like protein
VKKEEGGTHADEIETALMLYIDPALVASVGERRPGPRPAQAQRVNAACFVRRMTALSISSTVWAEAEEGWLAS